MKHLRWTAFFLALLLPAASVFCDETPVARVGEDGVLTADDYELYIQRYARQQGLSLQGMSRGDKKKALQLALDDEMLFQAAIAKGVHKDKEIRAAIIADYNYRHKIAGVVPSQFTDEELQSYYDAHPEEFKRPFQVRLKSMSFPSKSPEAEEAYVQARSNPKLVSRWKDMGWVSKGDRLGDLSAEAYDSVFGLRKGEVSALLKDAQGAQFIFWAGDHRDPEMLDFKAARGRAKGLVMKEKIRENARKLSGEIAKSGTADPDEAAFQAALKEGVHKSFQARQRIINTFLSGERTTRDIMVPIIRGHYDVEILDKELKKY